MVVQEGDEIMMITLEGIMIRVSVEEISIMGRTRRETMDYGRGQCCRYCQSN